MDSRNNHDLEELLNERKRIGENTAEQVRIAQQELNDYRQWQQELIVNYEAAITFAAQRLLRDVVLPEDGEYASHIAGEGMAAVNEIDLDAHDGYQQFLKKRQEVYSDILEFSKKVTKQTWQYQLAEKIFQMKEETPKKVKESLDESQQTNAEQSNLNQAKFRWNKLRMAIDVIYHFKYAGLSNALNRLLRLAQQEGEKDLEFILFLQQVIDRMKKTQAELLHAELEEPESTKKNDPIILLAKALAEITIQSQECKKNFVHRIEDAIFSIGSKKIKLPVDWEKRSVDLANKIEQRENIKKINETTATTGNKIIKFLSILITPFVFLASLLAKGFRAIYAVFHKTETKTKDIIKEAKKNRDKTKKKIGGHLKNIHEAIKDNTRELQEAAQEEKEQLFEFTLDVMNLPDEDIGKCFEQMNSKELALDKKIKEDNEMILLSGKEKSSTDVRIEAINKQMDDLRGIQKKIKEKIQPKNEQIEDSKQRGLDLKYRKWNIETKKNNIRERMEKLDDDSLMFVDLLSKGLSFSELKTKLIVLDNNGTLQGLLNDEDYNQVKIFISSDFDFESTLKQLSSEIQGQDPVVRVNKILNNGFDFLKNECDTLITSMTSLSSELVSVKTELEKHTANDIELRNAMVKMQDESLNKEIMIETLERECKKPLQKTYRELEATIEGLNKKIERAKNLSILEENICEWQGAGERELDGLNKVIEDNKKKRREILKELKVHAPDEISQISVKGIHQDLQAQGKGSKIAPKVSPKVRR